MSKLMSSNNENTWLKTTGPYKTIITGKVKTGVYRPHTINLNQIRTSNSSRIVESEIIQSLVIPPIIKK